MIMFIIIQNLSEDLKIYCLINKMAENPELAQQNNFHPLYKFNNNSQNVFFYGAQPCLVPK